MWSFVVVDLQNKLDLKSFLTFIKANYKDYEIIYCSTEKKKSSEIRQYVFDNKACTESVINTVINKCNGQKIAIIRDVKIYSEVLKLTNELKEANQVVLFNKKTKGFKAKIKNFLFRVSSFLFGQKLKDVELGVSVYGQIATSVLKTVSRPSNLTRTNNFTGVTFTCVDTVYDYKFKYDKREAIFYSLVPIFMFTGLVLTKVITKFKISFMFDLFYYSAIILSFIFAIIFGLVWFTKSQIGENVNDKSKYL